MVFIIDLLINKFEETKKIIIYILIILLIIGAITPGFEFFRAIKTVCENKTIFCVADDLVTFSNKNKIYFTNFLSENTTNSIFIKYLIKNK